jgi:hypothetical protein
MVGQCRNGLTCPCIKLLWNKYPVIGCWVALGIAVIAYGKQGFRGNVAAVDLPVPSLDKSYGMFKNKLHTIHEKVKITNGM